MLQKISYDVVFDPSLHSRAGNGMLMVRASQGKRSIDFPTNIYCERNQFSNGYINELHPQHDGLNAMLNQIVMELQSTEVDAFRRGIDVSVQAVYTIYTEKISAQTPLVAFCDNIMKNSLNIKYFHQTNGQGGAISTGFNTNAGAGGKTLLVILSWHWDSGSATGSRVDMIKFPYSGNSFASENIKYKSSSPDYDPSYDEYYGAFQVLCKCETKVTIIST